MVYLAQSKQEIELKLRGQIEHEDNFEEQQYGPEDDTMPTLSFRKIKFQGLAPDKLEGLSGSSDSSQLNRIDDDFINQDKLNQQSSKEK